MKLTVPQYRLLVRLLASYQRVRPTSQPARNLVEMGFATWAKEPGSRTRKVLCITPAGRERI